MDREINRNQAERLTPSERAARVKKLKRKRRLRLAIVVLAFILIVALIVCPIIMFAVFRVNNYIVEGISPYSKDQIISASGIEQGKSLFMIDVDEAEAIMEKALPYIDGVEITKKLPDSVVIRYGETSKAFAIELGGGTYALTDSNLKVLEHSSDAPEGLTLIKGASPSKSEVGEIMAFTRKDEEDTESKDKTFALILEITRAVAENKMEDIDLIDVSSINDIYFIYQKRLVLRLGEPSDLASKISLGRRVVDDENKIDPSQYATVNLTIAKKAYVNPADPEDIKELVIFNGGQWRENETQIDETAPDSEVRFDEESTKPETDE